VPAQVLNALPAVICLTYSAIESPFCRHKLRVDGHGVHRCCVGFRMRRASRKKSIAQLKRHHTRNISCNCLNLPPHQTLLMLVTTGSREVKSRDHQSTNDFSNQWGDIIAAKEKARRFVRKPDAAKRCGTAIPNEGHSINLSFAKNVRRRDSSFCFACLSLLSSLSLFLCVSFSPAGKEGSRLDFNVEN